MSDELSDELFVLVIFGEFVFPRLDASMRARARGAHPLVHRGWGVAVVLNCFPPVVTAGAPALYVVAAPGA